MFIIIYVGLSKRLASLKNNVLCLRRTHSEAFNTILGCLKKILRELVMKQEMFCCV